MISTLPFLTLAKISFPSGPGTSFSLANPNRSDQNAIPGSTASTMSTGASDVTEKVDDMVVSFQFGRIV